MANPIRVLLDRPNDDTVKTVVVAATVALVCAVVVSVTSVMLEPYQAAHVARERQARMDQMLDALPGMRELMLETGVTALETRMVDLRADDWAPAADPAAHDYEAAVGSDSDSLALTETEDPAGLRRIPALMPVYLLERDGALMLIVLPVRGAGYASTIKAMLALEPSLDTIAGLTILEQGETPGLGARIQEPEWQARWPGTAVTDGAGTLAVAVVRDGADQPWEVDGISGATRTSNGVQNMLRFWLGEQGYGPFLDRLRAGGI